MTKKKPLPRKDFKMPQNFVRVALRFPANSQNSRPITSRTLLFCCLGKGTHSRFAKGKLVKKMDGSISLTLEELNTLIEHAVKPPPPPSGALIFGIILLISANGTLIVGLGNPGPLGLGGFALTTFVLSVFNGNRNSKCRPLIVLS